MNSGSSLGRPCGDGEVAAATYKEDGTAQTVLQTKEVQYGRQVVMLNGKNGNGKQLLRH